MVTAQPHPDLRRGLLPVVAVLVVVGALIAALVLLGSPAEERRRWADDRRMQDLTEIKMAVDRFYRQHKRLPPTLDALPAQSDLRHLTDAQTKQPYGYRILAAQEYELGATFEVDTSQAKRPEEIRHSQHDSYYYAEDRTLPFWKHPKGAATFRLKVDTRAES